MPMQPRKKRRSSGSSGSASDMDPLSDTEDTFSLPRKAAAKGDKGRGDNDKGRGGSTAKQQQAEVSKEPTAGAAAVFSLPLHKIEDDSKPPAKPDSATHMESTSSSVAGSAAPAPGHAPLAHPEFPRIVAALRAQEQPKLDDDEMREILRQISGLTFKSEEKLLHAVRDCSDKQSLMVTLGALGFRGAPVSDLADAIQKIRPPAKPERRLTPRIDEYKAPQAQYKELVAAFNARGALQLKKYQALFDREAQDRLLGPFSPPDRETIPFFINSQKEVPDLRFASMVPGLHGPYRTHEGKSLFTDGEAWLFRAASGGGKTSTIFDAGCVQPMIYVACNARREASEQGLEEAVTNDKVFPMLLAAVRENCEDRFEGVELEALQAEGRRLIMADICARLSFLLWLYQQYEDEDNARHIDADELLLAQLNGGRDWMVKAFRLLRYARRDTLDELASHCVLALDDVIVQRHGQGVRLHLAIDEAQEAAKHFNDEAGFHFRHHKRGGRRSILYEYVELWREYVPTVVIAGTGLTSNAAGDLPTYVNKEIVGPVELPFLDVDGVKARLEMMLDLSDIDWSGVRNLELITGRPRWVAATIRKLMDVVKSFKRERRQGQDFKATALTTAINEVYESWVRKLAGDLVTQVDQAPLLASDSVLGRLCKQLHAVSWLFQDQAQGMHIQCDADDTGDMLALGLVLLVKAAPEQKKQGRTEEAASEAKVACEAGEPTVQSPPRVSLMIGNKSTVMMDSIGKAAAQLLAERQGWDPSDYIARKIAAATDANAIEFGYRFETLVAAAVVDFSDSIADLIRAADSKNYGSKSSRGRRVGQKVPDWTTEARFNCSYRVCDSYTDVCNALQETLRPDSSLEKDALIKPDNLARADFILASRRQPCPDFDVYISAKCYTNPLGGDDRENDFDTTKPRKQYTVKPGAQQTDMFRAAKATFDPILDQMTAQSRGRVLRLHAVLPGYAKNEHTSTAPAPVEIDGDEVRVIIDRQNYQALFATAEMQRLLAGIIMMKGYKK